MGASAQIKHDTFVAALKAGVEVSEARMKTLEEQGIDNVIKRCRRFFFFKHNRKTAREYFLYGSLFDFQSHTWIKPYWDLHRAGEAKRKCEHLLKGFDTQAIEPLVTVDEDILAMLSGLFVLENASNPLTG